jgi:hypothetical protein
MRLVENSKVVIKDALQGTGGLQTAGNGVSMAKYNRCRITLLVACSDAAVVGGAVLLKQGTSATCSTALAYAEYWKKEDVLAADMLTRVAAATCAAGVRNKTAMYVFEVKSDQLDSDTHGSENTYIRLDLADITTATEAHSLIYELYEPRVALGAEDLPTAW